MVDFQVFINTNIPVVMLLIITPCSLVGVYQSFVKYMLPSRLRYKFHNSANCRSKNRKFSNKIGDSTIWRCRQRKCRGMDWVSQVTEYDENWQRCIESICTELIDSIESICTELIDSIESICTELIDIIECICTELIDSSNAFVWLTCSTWFDCRNILLFS